MQQQTGPGPLRFIATTLVTALTLVLVLSACGDGESATPTTDAPATTAPGDDVPDLSVEEFDDLTAQTAVDVQARDNNFVPAYIEVKAGTTVTFTNRGRNQHNVLPTTEGAFPSIEVDDLEPGTSQDVTFEEAGDYPYYCSLHGTKTKGMVGAVRVMR